MNLVFSRQLYKLKSVFVAWMNTLKRECTQDDGAEQLWEEYCRMLIPSAQVQCRPASSPRQKWAAMELSCEDWRGIQSFPFK